MSGTRYDGCLSARLWLAGVLLAALGGGNSVRGQSAPLPATPTPVVTLASPTTQPRGSAPVPTGDVQQAGCASCGGGLPPPPMPSGSAPAWDRLM